MGDNDFSIDNSIITTRFKIVVLGDVAVGKSSLISRFVDNRFKGDYEPSIGVDFASKSIKYNDKIIKLQIWDTAGQEKYKSLIPSYIRGSNIIFVMYDITSKSIL
jgi:small GTP-binding protein